MFTLSAFPLSQERRTVDILSSLACFDVALVLFTFLSVESLARLRVI